MSQLNRQQRRFRLLFLGKFAPIFLLLTFRLYPCLHSFSIKLNDYSYIIICFPNNLKRSHKVPSFKRETNRNAFKKYQLFQTIKSLNRKSPIVIKTIRE